MGYHDSEKLAAFIIVCFTLLVMDNIVTDCIASCCWFPIGLGLKKKVVCFLQPYPNKFLFQKIPTLKFFSALRTPNQSKTCIKHTFLTKKIMQKNIFYDLPTLFFSDRYRKQTMSFFRPYCWGIILIRRKILKFMN